MGGLPRELYGIGWAGLGEPWIWIQESLKSKAIMPKRDVSIPKPR